MAELIFKKGESDEKRYRLGDDSFLIGRDVSCDLVLDDPSVSRRHAVIIPKPDGYVLVDLGSKNGTVVNASDIKEARLAGKDSLEFGNVGKVVFENRDSEAFSIDGTGSETILCPKSDLKVGQLRLGFLCELAQATSTIEDEAKLAGAILNIVRTQLQCESVYLGLIDAESGQIGHADFDPEAFTDQSLAYSHAIVQRAMREKTAILVKDAGSDEDWRQSKSIAEKGIRSALCIPMVVGGQNEGVLYADTRSRVREFDKDDLALAGALGPLLGAIFRNLRAKKALRKRNLELTNRLGEMRLIGDHKVMVRARQTISNFASKGHAPVLIQGESGTGKELAARNIHRLSSRADKLFADINCAAMQRDLMESELFGHVKGAFTSASANRRGLFELADEGTLFFDEIAEIPLELQAKLLRVLEIGTFRPIGSEHVRRADVRIVAATNRDLAQRVEQGRFRQDLYFRLNVLFVQMPSLRSHIQDVPRLAEHFLAELSRSITTRVSGFSKQALDLMMSYDWPGNVRELRNSIERALYSCANTLIAPGDLFWLEKEATAGAPESAGPDARVANLEEQLEQAEKARVVDALESNQWNRTKAAGQLGVSRKTLLARMKKFSLIES